METNETVREDLQHGSRERLGKKKSEYLLKNPITFIPFSKFSMEAFDKSKRNFEEVLDFMKGKADI